MFRRFGAFIVDLSLVIILTVFIALPLRGISGYAAASDRMEAIFNSIASQHGVDVNITQQQYNALPDEEKLAMDAAFDEIRNNEEASELYSKTVKLTMIITFSSLFVAVVILEVVLPLIFKNGQSLGKKLMRLEVRRRDEAPINFVTLVLRSISGKFFLDYGLPVFFFFTSVYANAGRTPLIGIMLLAVGQIVSIAVTSDRRALHDLLAGTYVYSEKLN